MSRSFDRRLLGFGVVAVLVHALALSISTRGAKADAPPAAIEIEVTTPVPELVAPTPDPPTTATTIGTPMPNAAATGASKPMAVAAKAGALLTAKDDAPHDKEPVPFVTDPDGDEYGTGVVKKGGTAIIGAGSSTAPPQPVVAAASTTAPPKITQPPPAPPIFDFSSKPRLDEPNACKGFFPTAADDDVALVTLKVVVRADGEVSSAQVLHEEPAGQGFGAAARTCLLRKRFTPGLDMKGMPTQAETRVNVRFAR